MLIGMATTIGSKQRPPHLYMEEWRNHLDLTVVTVANRVETNRETIWRWENEQHRLNPGKIGAYAAALNIQPAQLFHPPPADRAKPVTQDDLDNAIAEVKRLIRK